MSESWDGYRLPNGARLRRDPDFGFYRVMPRPSDEEIAHFYANAYRNPCIPHDMRRCVELVTDHHPEVGRVLDIGCGQGAYLSAFVDAGWQAVGIEPGASDAATARRQGIEVIEDMLTPEVATELGHFDAVILAHVLEHLVEPERMLAMVHGLLRPGGVFFCEVPNDFSVLQEIAARHCQLPPWWIALPDHLNYFGIDSLATFIAAHGFTVVTQTSDFPMEMFLLMGDVYVGNPDVGKAMHRKRCNFEQAFRETGRVSDLNRLYRALAAAGMGREAIVLAVRP